ncbi:MULTISPECIES: helix-turn-helix domain-containing protein [unclassified Streptomyces]|uniref:helix-turn-helix domain-containing protein n=1 Tax=unclassified Streptomyces TaxID=2593676 RepID=UPI003804D69F
MRIEDLLQLEPLGLSLLWGEERLLTREISGVTATDLEDPARFLQQGEIVLSGLVWWSAKDGGAKTDRFVSALRGAGAAALLAGEETHGTVPRTLVDSCREHGIVLLAVPARTSFRAITDAVYLRQWGDLSRRPTPHYALPENVRNELGGLLAEGAEPDVLLNRAFAHLGMPACYLLSASGRTVARTPTAPRLPAQRAAQDLKQHTGVTVRVDADSSPFDRWYLHLPGAAEAPPRALAETADILTRYRDGLARGEVTAASRAFALVSLIDAGSTDEASLHTALRACGLAGPGPYEVITARQGGDEETGTAAAALTEALRYAPSRTFAVAELAGGEAVAVVQGDESGETARELRESWPLVHACRPAAPLHGGIGAAAPAPQGLAGSLAQARYARAVAAATAPRSALVTSVDDLTTLDALLAGIPADVRAIYSSRVLGPLARGEGASHRMLLETLEVFLRHNGSWARTAEALHLHVNTVHYRIQRIERLTGRDLTRLDHKLDLRAALYCR